VQKRFFKKDGRPHKEIQDQRCHQVIFWPVNFGSSIYHVGMKEENRKNRETIQRVEEENHSLKIKLDGQIGEIQELQMKERKIMMAMKMKNMELQKTKDGESSKAGGDQKRRSSRPPDDVRSRAGDNRSMRSTSQRPGSILKPPGEKKEENTSVLQSFKNLMTGGSSNKKEKFEDSASRHSKTRSKVSYRN
jgi:hypothetical protein